MFGKLKEKLDGWFKSSKKKIEEIADLEESKIVETENEGEIKKVEKIIEESKKQPSEPVLSKFDVARKQFEPDLEKIKEEAEGIKKETDEAKKQ